MKKKFALVISLFLIPGLLLSRDREGAVTFAVSGADAQPWLKILGSVGISRAASGDASIVIAGPSAQADLAALAQVLRARIRSSDRASARFRSSDVPAWSAGPRTSSPQWCMAGVTRRQHRFY